MDIKKIKNIILFSLAAIVLLAGLIFSAWKVSTAYDDYKLRAEIDSWLAEHEDYLSSFDENKNKKADVSFFQSNSDFNGAISPVDFAKVFESQVDDYIIIDAREGVEQDEEGYFDGSIHMRLADLKAGRWIELDQNKLVYVVCSRSFRGQVITDFLREKNIPARYLEGGLRGWIVYQRTIKDGQEWTIKSSVMDGLPVFSVDSLKQHLSDGGILVDSRKPSDFKEYSIEGSINISAMATPSADMENVLSRVPESSQIVLVCDGHVTCFDSRITGYELYQEGHSILGYFKDIRKY